MQALIRRLGGSSIWNRIPLRTTIRSVQDRSNSVLTNCNQTNNVFKLPSKRLPHDLAPYLQCNCYSSDSQEPPKNDSNQQRILPKLSDQPVEFGAPFFSFITSNIKALKIRNTLDGEFSLQEFIQGSKKAVEIVSQKLSSSDIDGLRGLVANDIIDDLRDKIAAMTEAQRSLLLVDPADICKEVVSNISFIEKGSSTVVEISTVFHAIKGFGELKRGEIKPTDIFQKSNAMIEDEFCVLNYKFSKEFAEGVNDDWIICHLNHISMKDELDQHTKELQDLMRKFKEHIEKK